MLLALELLLVGQLAAGLDDAVLGGDVGRIRAGRHGRRRSACGRRAGGRAREAARRLRDLQAGHEAFEITLLLGLEITGHGVLELR